MIFGVLSCRKNRIQCAWASYPCDRVLPLIDALCFILWARWLLLLQKLHSVPRVLQLRLVALPKLQEQSDYSQEMNREKTTGRTIMRKKETSKHTKYYPCIPVCVLVCNNAKDEDKMNIYNAQL